MVAAIDITGQRFGKLTAVRRSGSYANGQARWELHCDCGGTSHAHTGELRAGRRKGCQQCAKKSHGMKGTRLYRTWESMHQRCRSSTHPSFHRYGGRGIKVCEEWQQFAPFGGWALLNGYRDDLEIDRIDNDAGYSPENCRFVTRAENAANRSCSRRVL